MASNDQSEPSTSGTQRIKSGSTNTGKPIAPKEKAVEILRRIPVAGLEDLLIATFPPEKWMWRITLVAAILGTAYYNYGLTEMFSKHTLVQKFDLVDPSELPFPFVYVCPMYAMNRSYVKELFPFPMVQRLIQSDPTGLPAMWTKRLKMTTADFYEEWLKYASFRILEGPHFDERLVNSYESIWDMALAEMGSRWRSYSNLYEKESFLCQEVLKECKFNGEPFDCCPVNENMTNLEIDAVCFGINVSTSNF